MEFTPDQTKLLRTPIKMCKELSGRSRNNLFFYGRVETVSDLVDKTKEDLLRIENFGIKSLKEVIDFLEEYGLELRKSNEHPQSQSDEVRDLEGKKRKTYKVVLPPSIQGLLNIRLSKHSFFTEEVSAIFERNGLVILGDLYRAQSSYLLNFNGVTVDVLEKITKVVNGIGLLQGVPIKRDGYDHPYEWYLVVDEAAVTTIETTP